MSKIDHGKVKKLRVAKGMTQEAFCAATGIPLGTYRDIEQGKSDSPHLDIFLAIVKVHNLEVEDVILADGEQVKSPAPSRGRPKLSTMLFGLASCGVVSAGESITHVETQKKEVKSFREILGDGVYFFGQVSGDSMTSRNIRNRDTAVFVEETEHRKVPNGEIVLVRIGGGLILKELNRLPDGRIILRSRSDNPKNKDVTPNEVEPGELIGICIGTLRPSKSVVRLHPVNGRRKG